MRSQRQSADEVLTGAATELHGAAHSAGGVHEDHMKREARCTSDDPQAELRRRYVAVCRAHVRACKAADAAGLSWPDPRYPRWPDMSPLEGLRCGARGKRTGRPCPHTSIYANGRCRWHGGLSTGPKTPEGKARCALNGNAPKRTP